MSATPSPTTNAKSVPEWARAKARNLLISAAPTRSIYAPSTWIVNVVADLIAEHEEAPVDPLLIEAREICKAALEGNCGAVDWKYDDTPMMKAAIACLRRGIELAGEQK